MTVREASTDDIDAIRHVVRASWETDYPDILSRETVEAGIEDWYASDRLRDELTASQAHPFVAVVDETVVGFAHAVLNEADEGHILRLYTHPDYRRRGLGRRLFERTRDELFEQGADRIYAMVLADNDLGNAFYRDLGFEQVAETETTIGGDTYRENTLALRSDRS